MPVKLSILVNTFLVNEQPFFHLNFFSLFFCMKICLGCVAVTTTTAVALHWNGKMLANYKWEIQTRKSSITKYWCIWWNKSFKWVPSLLLKNASEWISFSMEGIQLYQQLYFTKLYTVSALDVRYENSKWITFCRVKQTWPDFGYTINIYAIQFSTFHRKYRKHLRHTKHF